MKRSARGLALLLGLATAAEGRAAVALLAANGGGAGGGASGVAVVPLGNEGVLLVAGERRVVVDALFGDGLPGYATVAPARRADLEAARGEFSGVGLVLATHAHRDHFDADAVARFVSTPEAVAATGLAVRGVDLALVPFWRLLDEGDRAAIRRALRPAQLAAIHVPISSAPAAMFGTDGGRSGLDAALGLRASGVVLFDLDTPTLHLAPAATLPLTRNALAVDSVTALREP